MSKSLYFNEDGSSKIQFSNNQMALIAAFRSGYFAGNGAHRFYMKERDLFVDCILTKKQRISLFGKVK